MIWRKEALYLSLRCHYPVCCPKATNDSCRQGEEHVHLQVRIQSLSGFTNAYTLVAYHMSFAHRCMEFVSL